MWPALLSFALLLCCCAVAPAQQCNFGGDAAFRATEKLLSDAKTCSSASHILERCAWGSSADSVFSTIVIEKCESSFLKNLTTTQASIYKEKMQLCAEKYAGMDGTIHISEAALCKVGVAVDFESNPIKASTPIPQASFNCAHAITRLEHAICSNRELGIADINLSDAYRAVIRVSSQRQRRFLIENEKIWLKSLPTKCKLSAQSKQLEEPLQCLRAEFRGRFDFFDFCSMGGPQECVEEIKSTR